MELYFTIIQFVDCACELKSEVHSSMNEYDSEIME